MAGQIIDWRVPSLRGVEPDLRRARLLAARGYAPGSKPRHAILGGYWDGGTVVRAHRRGEA
jgi:hypothetical protein